jgi:hypothetical protein
MARGVVLTPQGPTALARWLTTALAVSGLPVFAVFQPEEDELEIYRAHSV